MKHVKHWIGKLQVPTEPGLSTSELMLTNDDLRPGEMMPRNTSMSATRSGWVKGMTLRSSIVADIAP
ncbi:hypothetical protein N7510_006503 [Penicillium lagena]|uniref:uncharacterized protein n=1 Tax=Penicillium lagena TaxID=94218 RepID=UPI0025416E51|nr:uncharacterized protein N7510_006503 [Penicillium lagena]KAJ5613309.1 hypothetical protein N7510_006503 [Penicillium lagena]